MGCPSRAMGMDWTGRVLGAERRVHKAGFVYKRGGGILDKTHPPNFGPTHPTFDPPRPPPLLQFCGEHFL